jgi:hypothetical protein
MMLNVVVCPRKKIGEGSSLDYPMLCGTHLNYLSESVHKYNSMYTMQMTHAFSLWGSGTLDHPLGEYPKRVENERILLGSHIISNLSS